MKVFKNKITGRLGETQFGEDAEVLICNARSSGFKEQEIEIVDISLSEYCEMIKIQNENDTRLTREAKKIKEEKIRNKLNLTDEEWHDFKEVIR